VDDVTGHAARVGCRLSVHPVAGCYRELPWIAPFLRPAPAGGDKALEITGAVVVTLEQRT
jgi:hypothetical protein